VFTKYNLYRFYHRGTHSEEYRFKYYNLSSKQLIIQPYQAIQFNGMGVEHIVRQIHKYQGPQFIIASEFYTIFVYFHSDTKNYTDAHTTDSRQTTEFPQWS
jgi:hypothetical protein